MKLIKKLFPKLFLSDFEHLKRNHSKLQDNIFNLEMVLLKLSLKRNLTPQEMEYEIMMTDYVEFLHRIETASNGYIESREKYNYLFKRVKKFFDSP